MNRRIRLARALRGEWDTLSPSQQAPWLRMADRVLESKNMPKQKRKRLVENKKDWWRWGSTHAALLLSGLASQGVLSLGIVASVVSMLPPELRSFIPLPVTAALFGSWLLLRLIKQRPDA